MHALAPLTAFFLLFSSTFSRHCEDPSDINAIHYTINSYAFVIDTGNWDALSTVFTDDVQANYSTVLGFLNGLPALKAALSRPLPVDSMHVLSTQTVNITGKGKASTMTYVTAWFFGRGVYVGQFYNIFARYDDTLVRGHDNSWKINKRNAVLLVRLQ
ncbi:MAG: hypothetical protein M1813_007720 [Trichoglossum hirsutum]|nr:MAG: hypothetical protein M1813_007720 [Trichoglossum hirsutum]